MRLLVLTNSEIRTYRRCAREHRIAYRLGYRPLSKAEALRFGSLKHLGLEHWWRATSDRLAAALAAVRGEPCDEYDLAKAEALLIGYDARWGDEPFEVIGVESEFCVPLVNPETGAASRTYVLGGKLDVLVRDLRDGLIKLVEHKTTSEDITPGSAYWRRLLIDPQVSTYFAGAKASGHDIAECVYDVIGKPALRPASVSLLDDDGLRIVLDANGVRVRTKDGKRWRQTADLTAGYVLQSRPETPEEYGARILAAITEDPDRYYQRGTVVRLESEEADAAYDAWATARQIRESELAGRWPRNPDACIRYGRTCDYFDVCTGNASLDDATQFRRVENVHEELTEGLGLTTERGGSNANTATNGQAHELGERF